MSTDIIFPVHLCFDRQLAALQPGLQFVLAGGKPSSTPETSWGRYAHPSVQQGQPAAHERWPSGPCSATNLIWHMYTWREVCPLNSTTQRKYLFERLSVEEYKTLSAFPLTQEFHKRIYRDKKLVMEAPKLWKKWVNVSTLLLGGFQMHRYSHITKRVMKTPFLHLSSDVTNGVHVTGSPELKQ